MTAEIKKVRERMSDLLDGWEAGLYIGEEKAFPMREWHALRAESERLMEESYARKE
jgi:hypothetical protein